MIKKIISILIAFILIATLLINGSYFFDLLTYRLDFSHSEIYVSVGETLDLNTFIKDYEKAPSDIKYESSNAQVGHILENKFIALEKGETTVSAKCKNKKAYMKIISAYDEITSLQIHTDTDKAIRIFDIDEMEFVVQTDDNAQPSANILWSINGVNSSITGPNFYYTPTKIGRYVVKAEATDYNVSAQYEFVVYGQNTTTQFSFSGQLEQQNEYAPVIFSIDELSGFSLVEWYVNGEVSKQVIAQDTSNAGFEFYPSKAGIYDITCKVNGKEISNASLNDVVIKAYGKMPIENLRIDYDSSYPNIYVEWDAPIGSGEYVIDIDGIQYSSITHHDKFYENKFDATGILDVFVPQNVKLTYKGDNVFASASAEINHTALKINALSYLSKQYLSGNYYMTSDQEVYDIFAYAMTFRPDEYSSTINSKACTEVNLKLYMAYSSEYSPSQLTENAWQMASQTGSYYLDTKGSTSKNNIYQIKISFVTTNIPENFSTLGKIKYDSINYPHVSNNDYDGNYPIDSYPLSFDKVSSTEELYYVVNAGYKPNLQENSTAQQIYQQARDVLDCIISDDMSQVDIVHAIFDYIMWTVSYDYDALEYNSLAQSVLQPAFYLDGVFETGFAVCDGIAKAYSLMCNIAGLECVRVVGTAKSGEKVAEHAWNKVKIENEWYMVDCTWSDFLTSISDIDMESASHKYFLLSDNDTKFSHFENNPSLYPRTAVLSYKFHEYKEENLMRIRYNGNVGAQISNIIAYAKANINFKYNMCGNIYYSKYFAIEIKVDRIIAMQAKSDFYSLLRSKLQSAWFGSYTYTIINFDEIYMILFA